MKGGRKLETIYLKQLRNYPELLEKAACWFSPKWKIPVEAYKDSMQECLKHKKEIPQWYILLDESLNIIAGAGVIENDFHDRKDLSPNLCALFVDEGYRKQGIAKYILDFIRKDFGDMGYSKLYLVTEHIKFYEKCGWEFLTMVNDDDGMPERMYAAPAIY